MNQDARKTNCGNCKWWGLEKWNHTVEEDVALCGWPCPPWIVSHDSVMYSHEGTQCRVWSAIKEGK